MGRRSLRRGFLLTLLCGAGALSGSASAADINTATITATTAGGALACARYKPIGVCYWLSCGLFGCVVTTSVKIGHYNPDLVVSAYHEVGGNPWVEMRTTLGAAAKAAGQAIISALIGVDIGDGNRTEGTTSRDHKNLRFKEANAIGHPIASMSSVPGFFGFACPSETKSFFPYLQSTLDALAWRTEIPESLFPAAWIPGLREIGGWPLNTWGGVYPRSGFVTQAEDPKAGAVIAQRAGDIVTRVAQPHVYLPTGPGGGAKMTGGVRVWLPPPLREKNDKKGWWQMLTPIPSDSCEAFGRNDTLSLASWADGKGDPGGDYAWNLWRPYKCCKQNGQSYLGSTDFIPYP